MTDMRHVVRQALVSAALIAVAPQATAHADDYQHFQSPSGNISCDIAALPGMTPEAMCEIVDRTWTAPPRPPDCDAAWGDRVTLVQGGWPAFGCHSDTTRDPRLPILAYGDSRTVAALTCTSTPDGVTCTDTSTGHFFHISREFYDLH